MAGGVICSAGSSVRRYTWTDCTFTITSTSASTSDVWTMWTTDGTGIYYADPFGAWVEQADESAERRDQRLAQLRRYREEQAERERAYQERLARETEELLQADRRAEELLIGCLDREQREQWRRERMFVVRGRSGRRYRIRQGTHGNIDVVDRFGRGLHRLCVQPGGVPTCDSVLAQKLWLENDEDGILRIANRHMWPGNEPLDRRPLILPTLQ